MLFNKKKVLTSKMFLKSFLCIYNDLVDTSVTRLVEIYLVFSLNSIAYRQTAITQQTHFQAESATKEIF